MDAIAEKKKRIDAFKSKNKIKRKQKCARARDHNNINITYICACNPIYIPIVVSSVYLIIKNVVPAFVIYFFFIGLFLPKQQTRHKKIPTTKNTYVHLLFEQI